MATATHIPTKLIKSQVIGAGPKLSFDSDVLKIMMVKAGSGIPSTTSTGVQFVSDVTATNPEDTNIGARQTLSGVTVVFDANGVQVDFSFSNVVYAQNAGDDGLSRYGVIYDETASSGTDATRPVIAILDFGQTVSVVAGSLTLQCPTGGLIQWTGGG